MFVVALLLSLVVAVVFVASGLAKLTGAPPALEMKQHLELSNEMLRGIGTLEVIGALGVLIGIGIAPLGVAAAIGLALLAAGAIGFHRRVGDAVTGYIPAIVVLGLAVVTAAARGIAG